MKEHIVNNVEKTDVSRNSFNNIEQEHILFFTDNVLPWINILERNIPQDALESPCRWDFLDEDKGEDDEI